MKHVAIGVILLLASAGRAHADDAIAEARVMVQDIDQVLADAKDLGSDGIRRTRDDRAALGILRSQIDAGASELASMASNLDSRENSLGWMETEIETLVKRGEHEEKAYEAKLASLKRSIRALRQRIKDVERAGPSDGSGAAFNAWQARLRELDAQLNRLVHQYNALLLQAKDSLARLQAKIDKKVNAYDRAHAAYVVKTNLYNARLGVLENRMDDAAARILRVLDVIDAEEDGVPAQPVMVTEARYRTAVARVKEIDARIAMHEKVLASIRMHARSLGKDRADAAVMRAAATEVSLAAAIDALGIGKRLRAMRKLAGAKNLLTPARVQAIESAFAAAVTGLHASRTKDDAKAREAAMDAGRKALAELALDLRKAHNRKLVRQIEAAAKLLDLSAKAGGLMLAAAEQSRRASWSGLAKELATFVADTAPALHPVVGTADASINVAERVLQWKVAEDTLKQLSAAMNSQDYAAMVHSRKLADLHQEKALLQRTIQLYEMSAKRR